MLLDILPESILGKEKYMKEAKNYGNHIVQYENPFALPSISVGFTFNGIWRAIQSVIEEKNIII